MILLIIKLLIPENETFNDHENYKTTNTENETYNELANYKTSNTENETFN
jgi:hypothetical protein